MFSIIIILIAIILNLFFSLVMVEDVSCWEFKNNYERALLLVLLSCNIYWWYLIVLTVVEMIKVI